MEELVAEFTLSEPEEIKATFKIDIAPKKLSELENDLGFITKEEVELPDVDTSQLVTKTDLENKNFATKSDIADALGEIENLLKEV